MTLGPPLNLPKIMHNRDILCAGPQYLKVIFHFGRFHILHLPGTLSWCLKITQVPEEHQQLILGVKEYVFDPICSEKIGFSVKKMSISIQ